MAGQASTPREFLQAGSLYQNAYMTLWNSKGSAISVMLNIKDEDAFELKIENLNSKGGGNAGWLAIKGGFDLAPLPDSPERQALIPKVRANEKAFSYDKSLFDGATAMMMRCLEKLSGAAVLAAVQLEVDTEHDAVMVTPRSRALRLLWNKAVVLTRVTEEPWH